MRQSPAGLVPARGFLKEGMAPRPSFNDGSNPGMWVWFSDVVFCWVWDVGDGTLQRGGPSRIV